MLTEIQFYKIFSKNKLKFLLDESMVVIDFHVTAPIQYRLGLRRNLVSNSWLLAHSESRNESKENIKL